MDVAFDAKACNLIASQVNDFNDLGLVTHCKLLMVRVVGELDPFYKDKAIFGWRYISIKRARPLSFF